ncbi:MAG: polysaccharide biosynthesis tyrosine autokinase [Planctomycetota bacterium]|jgi:capsular exopolysaccharide synthesis family protein
MILVVTVAVFVAVNAFVKMAPPVQISSVQFYFRTTEQAWNYDPSVIYQYPPFLTKPEMRPHLIRSERVMRDAAALLPESMNMSADKIRGCISVRLGENPDMITITAMHPSAEVSVAVRDAVQKAYVKFEIEQTGKMLLEEIRVVGENIANLEDQMSGTGAAIRKFLKEKYVSRGISDPETESKVQTQMLIELQRSRHENLIEAGKIDLLLKRHPTEMKKLQSEDLLAMHFPSNVQVPRDAGAAGGVTERLQSLEDEFHGMRRRYREEHPQLMRVREDIDYFRERLREAVAKARHQRREDLELQKMLMEEMAELLTTVIQREYEESFALAEDRALFSEKQRQMEQFQARIIRLKERLDEARNTRDIHQKAHEERVTKLRESGPTPAAGPQANLFLLIMLSIVIGVGVGFMLEYLSPFAVTEHDIRRSLSLKTLVTILRIPEKQDIDLLQAAPGSPLTEIFSSFGMTLETVMYEKGHRIFLIGSAVRGEGKTTIAVNTSIALARAGLRVLLVDADLRNPSVTKTLGVGEMEGLSELLSVSCRSGALSDEDLLARADELVVQSPQDNLNFVPAGTASQSSLEMLRHDDFRRILEVYKQTYDIVILDSPAVNPLSDTLHLVRLADAVALVVASGVTRKEDLTIVRRRLDQSWTKIIGAILNRASTSVAGYYYHRYYYGSDNYRRYRETK